MIRGGALERPGDITRPRRWRWIGPEIRSTVATGGYGRAGHERSTRMTGMAFDSPFSMRPQFVERALHIGVSVLPLALFLVATLGYEKVAHWKRGSVQSTIVTASTTVPATVEHFRDTRRLDDLERRPTGGDAAPERAGAEQASVRRLSFQLGEAANLPLGIDVSRILQPGAYAVLRGVPASATLSHGITASGDRWLVDGADIAALGLGVRAGAAGILAIEMEVLSSGGRLLARERIEIDVSEPAPQPVAEHFVPPMPLEVPSAAPAVDVPVTTAAVTEPPAPVASEPARLALGVTVSAGAPDGPGESRLMLTIEPSQPMPEGAFVVLSGLPPRASLSRGIAIGAGAWLLSPSDRAGIEMRLAEPPPSTLAFEVVAVASDGQRIASEALRYEISQPATGAIVADTTIATEAGLPRPTPREIATAQALAAESMTRASPPSPPAAYRTAAAPPVHPRAPSLDVPSWQSVLTRGRRMLELGNLAVARPLLERAARDGSAEAAALIGASYDEAWLKRQGALGFGADATIARQWYETARLLGAQDVERIVAGLLGAR